MEKKLLAVDTFHVSEHPVVAMRFAVVVRLRKFNRRCQFKNPRIVPHIRLAEPMRFPWILLLTLIVASTVSAEERAGDWTKRSFSSAPERVFDAALASIASLHYELVEKNQDRKVIQFKVGRSAFSWGYVVVLTVAEGQNRMSDVSAEVFRVRGPGGQGKASIFGSGKKEVLKVYEGIEEGLAEKTAP